MRKGTSDRWWIGKLKKPDHLTSLACPGASAQFVWKLAGTREMRHHALVKSSKPKVSRRVSKKGLSKKGQFRVRGKRVPPFAEEFEVFRTGRFGSSERSTRPSEEAGVLINKVGKALAHPGISRKSVFKRRSARVFSYSVDPGNPKRGIVRRSVDGQKAVSRSADSKFRRI